MPKVARERGRSPTAIRGHKPFGGNGALPIVGLIALRPKFLIDVIPDHVSLTVVLC